MKRIFVLIALFLGNSIILAQDTRTFISKGESDELTAPENLTLFLLIGQSNMAGRGEVKAEDRQSIPGVWMLNPHYEWVPAVDPMHFDKETAGAGLGRSFARMLIEACPEKQIGLIPCAYGGTSLDMWQSDKHLFRNAIYRTEYAMKSGRLAGILWHQGESDAASSIASPTYAVRFQKMMVELREKLQAEEVPVLVGTLGDFVKYRANGIKKFAPEINRQIFSLPQSMDRLGVVDSSGLKDGGDQLHFSTEALRELGSRYAREYLRMEPKYCEGSEE